MTKIADLKKGESISLEKLSKEEHKTLPPSRWTETKLISELEDKNIGRPSTFSSIVSLIQDRGYVKKKGTQLYPTPLGFAVSRILSAKFPQFTAYDYTSQMEDQLEDIIDGKQDRVNFLKSFWNGTNGFEKTLETILNNIDFKEIEQYSRIDLHNGYSIKYNRFGTFLQDDNGQPNDKGFLPSVKLDDDIDVWDYREAQVCQDLLKNAGNYTNGANKLGTLTIGEYKGWEVSIKEGRYGKYVQAVSADPKAKPVNHSLDKETDVDSLTLADIEPLFAEVKLPRTLNTQFFVGIGKRGPWIGFKKTPKSRKAEFKPLPAEYDPRTISLAEAKKVWEDHNK